MSVLTKKLLRTMYRNRGQVIAVVAVILCGTACYIAMTAVHRNLVLTRDTYYAQNRFADFEIMLERAPNTALFKVQEIPGVRQVRGRIVEEVKLDVEGVDAARTGRIVSMPDRRQSVLNNIVVTDGRYFEPGAMEEVILSEQFAEANGLVVGDSLDATIDGRKHTLRIVGMGLSPEYVYIIRNVQEFVPSPERFGILWVPEGFAEDAMNMQAACNNIVGSVEDLEQLEEILDSADHLLDSYGIFAKIKKENQVSNNFLSEEIKGLGVSAKVMPAIFLGIASLVIMVLLNRMVRNERTQIGLMKAYGYSNLAVAWHYVLYALLMSVAGCLLGFLAGHLIATGLIRVYVQYYQFPILQSRVYPDVLVRAMAISLAFSLFGAVVAARRAGQMSPAESMRPPAPRLGTRTFLERFTVLWVRLSFSWKMIARNVSRNKLRASLNVFGVMISSAMLIIGFYAMDAMDYIIEYQWERTQKQDVKVSFVMERGVDALHEAARFKYVREAEPVLQYPFEMRNGWRKKDVLVIGLPRDSKLQTLLDVDGRPIDVGEDGLVLSSVLAESLAVGVGDFVTLKPLMGRITDEKEVRVSQIVEEFFGMSSYMNQKALSRVLGESYALNAVLLRTDRGMARALNEQLKDVPLVGAVEVKEDSRKSLEDTLAQSMWIMNITVVIFAGVIAFSIIYNVTTVSLAERERELASLRVLGFSKQEVGRILFNENFMTGAAGLVLGIPLGLLICRAMMNMYDTELFRFPFFIAPNTLVISTAITTVFIAIANFAVRHKIHALDLVETLKSRE